MNIRSLEMFHLTRSRRHCLAVPRRDKITIVPSPSSIFPALTYIICTNPRSGS
jgi:hypothetical protein